MFPNRGQFTSNTDRRGFSPIGAYSIRYRQVQENFAKEMEERKIGGEEENIGEISVSLRPWISKDKDNNNNICLFFRFNAEETLRRQKENRDKRKAFDAAEERHRKEILNQRKQQQRQVLTQAKVTSSEYCIVVVHSSNHFPVYAGSNNTIPQSTYKFNFPIKSIFNS